MLNPFKKKTESDTRSNQSGQQGGSNNTSLDARLREQQQQEKSAKKNRSKSRRNARSVQQYLGYDYMFEDGICQVSDGLYSKTIWFSDVNYQTARRDVQEGILEHYCELLNYFDSSTTMQLSIVNHHLDEESFKNDVFLPMMNDNLDVYRKEMNQMLASKALEGQRHVSRDRYLTFSTHAPTHEKAAPLLARIETDVCEQFKRIGCETRSLSGVQRLELLAQHTLPDEQFAFDYNWLVKSNMSTKDYVCPDGLDFTASDSFMVGDKYAQVLFIKKLPPDLSDRFVSQIADLPIDMSLSFQIHGIDQGEALELVLNQITFMNQERVEGQKRDAAKGLYTENIGHELQFSLDEANELLNDLSKRNQRMFKMTALIYTVADTQEELVDNVFQIISSARKSTTQIAPLKYMQREGFNSVLPVGQNHVPIERTLTTISTAIFIPFTTQELVQKRTGAMYYGQNQLSNSFILFDRKSLKAPNGWVLGTPGSGKSFGCKREILNTFFGSPNDEIVIIDPENEYSAIVEALGGEVVKISTGSSNYLNPFDITAEYSVDAPPVSLKIDFILSLCELLIGGRDGLSPIQRSIIDRVCRDMYKNVNRYTTRDQLPNLKTFYQALLSLQGDWEAQQLARALEIYTHGPFAHNTNVDTSARIVSFETKEIGTDDNMKTFAMLVTLDQVWNRCTRNRERGVRTWVYIDEAQSFFDNVNAIKYFDTIWSRGRKYGVVPTGITQNIERILLTEKARMMLSNSEFVMMFNQSANDRRALGELLNLSAQQLSYVTNAQEGHGLLIAGGAVIPFKDKFPSDTALYKLITTKPEEVAAAKSFTPSGDVSTFVSKSVINSNPEAEALKAQLAQTYSAGFAGESFAGSGFAGGYVDDQYGNMNGYSQPTQGFGAEGQFGGFQQPMMNQGQQFAQPLFGGQEQPLQPQFGGQGFAGMPVEEKDVLSREQIEQKIAQLNQDLRNPKLDAFKTLDEIRKYKAMLQ